MNSCSRTAAQQALHSNAVVQRYGGTAESQLIDRAFTNFSEHFFNMEFKFKFTVIFDLSCFYKIFLI